MTDLDFLDILGVRFRVVAVEGASLVGLGVCDMPSARITIAQGLDPAIERRTLLHEVVHAIADSLDMNLSEAKIQALAVGLASIPQLRIEPEAEEVSSE